MYQYWFWKPVSSRRTPIWTRVTLSKPVVLRHVCMALQQQVLGGAWGRGFSRPHQSDCIESLGALYLNILFLKFPTKLGPETYSSKLVNLNNHLQKVRWTRSRKGMVIGKKVWLLVPLLLIEVANNGEPSEGYMGTLCTRFATFL